MYIVICGGGLQGFELCFLAKKAGFNICLIDKNPDCPAVKLADTFLNFDLLELEKHENIQAQEVNFAINNIIEHFLKADIIIPATENASALQALVLFCEKNQLILAFDEKAYQISSSKLLSRDLFLRSNTPIPSPFVNNSSLEYPLLAKPSDGSGSKGVQLFYNYNEFLHVFPKGVETSNWIFELFCDGPSYSVEICGKNGEYKTFALTGLGMDKDYDCNCVFFPSKLSDEDEEKIKNEAINLAKKLNLTGLMDLEVILTKDGYKVLEIDARFPSQTPIAVYFGTGINLLEQLIACFIDYIPKSQGHEPQDVYFAHAYFENDDVYFPGEHIMAEHGQLECGICNDYPIIYGRNKNSVGATFIIYSNELNPHHNRQNLKKEFENCLEIFKQTLNFN